jgi:hypothetical protein
MMNDALGYFYVIRTRYGFIDAMSRQTWRGVG